jgi:hypothetical protein
MDSSVRRRLFTARPPTDLVAEIRRQLDATILATMEAGQ